MSAVLSAQPAQQPQRGAPPAGRGAGRGAPATPQTPKTLAPIDLTGYWVSVITEDWRYRMVTAARGQHPGLPLSAEGNRVANAWDPAKDEAAGDLCKAYGAAGVMRLPGRIHITWGDSETVLKIDTEAGTQTRMLTFTVAQASGAPTAQGISAATWEIAGRGRGRGPASGGDLKVVTTHMKAGYLQRNGVPYGENAVQTEYFNRTTEPNGDTWLTITRIVGDPQYLNGELVQSIEFKKLPDSAAAQWAPTPCTAR
ncbi:MAG TPA: hypothetical protein VHZ73_01235 [Vicinamibacterales bacterium]|nr:hypothetical protein [Vicinamibacterales bacterium]